MVVVLIRFGEGRSCGVEDIVFSFSFGVCLTAAVTDLERETAALVVAPVDSFFLAVDAAVAAKEEVDNDGEGRDSSSEGSCF